MRSPSSASSTSRSAQPARRNEEGLDRLLGVGIDQGRAAGKLRKLAHERARTVGYDELGMSQRSAPSHIDPACQDNESAWRDFAGRDDAIVRRIGFELTEPPQPSDLRRLQHREPLIASRFDELTSRLRHDSLAGRLAISGYGCSAPDP